MTLRDKEQIKKALELIMNNTGFEEGIHILCSLVGYKYPVYDAVKNTKPINVTELLKQTKENKT